MKEPTVPWWRRALRFALGGIVGLFRRNGKTESEAATGIATQAGPAFNRREASNQESRVNPSSPQSESVAANEVDAPQFEPAANVAARSAEEPAPEPPASSHELPAATVSESEIPTPPAPIAQAVEELAAEQRNAKGHDFSRAVCTAQFSGALAPETALPIAGSAIPSESESTEEPAAATPVPPSETTQTAEAASAEEMSEPIEIAAEATPEEATVPEVESTPEEETAPSGEPESAQSAEAAPQEAAAPEPAEEPTETPAPESEPNAAALPAPPSAPQDIAPKLPFAEKPQRTTAEKVAAMLKARGEDAEQSPFSVMVNEVYDGPLDLLLDLIRKQDIDIYDIPIAKITAQFLAYVDQLRASDMDVAGEFIYTAALLIHIKSKMLLPRAPAGPDDAAEDPRRELVERLLEHERFKNAAQMLLEKQMLEAATWTNPGIREFQEDTGAEPEIAADTTDLVRIFGSILERARNRPMIDVEEDSVTVSQMIQFLARRLTMEDEPVALRRLLSHTKSERALIAMFLALLELVRLQAILLRQDRHFSEIFIRKNTGFDALMNQGLANARDDWR
jgi:segregation and condensation protein A